MLPVPPGLALPSFYFLSLMACGMGNSCHSTTLHATVLSSQAPRLRQDLRRCSRGTLKTPVLSGSQGPQLGPLCRQRWGTLHLTQSSLLITPTVTANRSLCLPSIGSGRSLCLPFSYGVWPSLSPKIPLWPVFSQISNHYYSLNSKPNP